MSISPRRESHIFSSMGIMGGSTLLITLFIVMMFSLAIYIIFKQKRLSEMKNDFVNNMTHELKTPISTISLASQMLNDRSIPDEQKNLSQISRIIQAESKQLGFPGRTGIADGHFRSWRAEAETGRGGPARYH